MPTATDYRWIRSAEWRFVVRPGVWNDKLQNRIMAVVDQQPWSKHPQTLSFGFSDAGESTDLFLKIYHPTKGSSAWKNLLRRSKALQAWRQGVALTGAGFNTPVTLAAGERRRLGMLRRGFVLTQKVAGQGAPVFLRELIETSSDKIWLKAKRAGLRQLAALIRRLHESGFVHGDLVATNIFIDRSTDDIMSFYLMDNDRTRRYPRWLPQSLWKRNLVQLNRLPLPGITLQDRMRFYCAYLGRSKLTAVERNLTRWFEWKTRQRRIECDRVDASGDFRRLMRWTGDVPTVDV
jgi:Lipopolysaccharide kinase (Kdo/WaaP) family